MLPDHTHHLYPEELQLLVQGQQVQGQQVQGQQVQGQVLEKEQSEQELREVQGFEQVVGVLLQVPEQFLMRMKM